MALIVSHCPFKHCPIVLLQYSYHVLLTKRLRWKLLHVEWEVVIHRKILWLHACRLILLINKARDSVKNHENRKSFPAQKFCRIRYCLRITPAVTLWQLSDYTSLVTVLLSPIFVMRFSPRAVYMF